jgi:L-asparaginase
MIAVDGVGSDGPQNLFDALLCAAAIDPQIGVCALLNGELHAARYVTKTKAMGLGAFSSYPGGAVGLVVEQRLHLLQQPVRALPRLDCRQQQAHRVAMIMAGGGDDLPLMRAAKAEGYAGLVVAALGAGHVHSDAVPMLAELVTEMPVIYASRSGGSCTATQTYGFIGSEASLSAAGLIPSGWMSAVKARTLLQAALATGCPYDEIRRIFAHVGGVSC